MIVSRQNSCSNTQDVWHNISFRSVPYPASPPGLLLEGIFLGVIFAKISHPKHRSRSLLISDTAVVARREGALKFMFRVADIAAHTVINPKISANLYTWGRGRTTAEGEFIPCRQAADCFFVSLMRDIRL